MAALCNLICEFLKKKLQVILFPKVQPISSFRLEPMESLRYLPWLKEDGWVVTNTTPFINIPDYPDMKELLAEIEKLPHHIALNADEIARQIKSVRSSNMVVLGAASPFIDIPYASLENGIKQIFGRKGEKIVH